MAVILYKPALLAWEIYRAAAIFSLNYESSYQQQCEQDFCLSSLLVQCCVWLPSPHQHALSMKTTLLKWNKVVSISFTLRINLCFYFILMIPLFFSDCVQPGLSCTTGSDCCSGLWCKWRGDEAFGRCLPWKMDLSTAAVIFDCQRNTIIDIWAALDKVCRI